MGYQTLLVEYDRELSKSGIFSFDRIFAVKYWPVVFPARYA